MGSASPPVTLVVFDTGVVVSALIFSSGPAGKLRAAWRAPETEALVSRATLDELLRVLAYSKFGLLPEETELLLVDFVPFSRLVAVAPSAGRGLLRCRDRHDQKFLELAAAGGAEQLVTGDRDLLDLAGRTPFEIVTVAEFLRSK